MIHTHYILALPVVESTRGRQISCSIVPIFRSLPVHFSQNRLEWSVTSESFCLTLQPKQASHLNREKRRKVRETRHEISSSNADVGGVSTVAKLRAEKSLSQAQSCASLDTPTA